MSDDAAEAAIPDEKHTEMEVSDESAIISGDTVHIASNDEDEGTCA